MNSIPTPYLKIQSHKARREAESPSPGFMSGNFEDKLLD